MATMTEPAKHPSSLAGKTITIEAESVDLDEGTIWAGAGTITLTGAVPIKYWVPGPFYSDDSAWDAAEKLGQHIAAELRAGADPAVLAQKYAPPPNTTPPTGTTDPTTIPDPGYTPIALQKPDGSGWTAEVITRDASGNVVTTPVPGVFPTQEAALAAATALGKQLTRSRAK
jgi:hypothetical protein